MSKSAKCLLFLMIIFPLQAMAQTNGSLVLRLEVDSKNISSLDVNSRSAVNSVFSEFLRDLLLVPGISVRTDQLDSRLREIQKQSQIDAGTGMGSDSSAYATDRGSKPTIVLTLRMNAKSSRYQFGCYISEIESMNLIGNVTSDFLPMAEFTEEKTDRFAYDVLLVLKQRGYISDIPSDVVSQLLHKESTSEAYRRYVQDYTKQIADAERELAELKAKHVSDAEKLEQESQQRALLLKIEMLEKTRAQTEALLEKQKAKDEADLKREQELQNATKTKQLEFSAMIKRLEEKQNEIRKESISLLSLKNRIELIERDKSNLAYLESQLEQYIQQSNSYFDSKCAEAVRAEESKPWRNGETDANNVPTAAAKKVRQKQIDKIKESYEAEKKNAAKELSKSVAEDLEGYKKQIADNLSEMQKTTYVFRSIDLTDNFLNLMVDSYDANKQSWNAHSDFNLNGIPKTDISKVRLPNSEITYRMMTGKTPADGSDVAEYEAYLDQVDMADLYFRTSVPYLYSEIALTVSYSESRDRYAVTPIYYRIYKTQDRSQVFSCSEKELQRLYQMGEIPAYTPLATEEKNPQTVTHNEFKRTVTSSSYKANLGQKGRNGIFVDASYAIGYSFGNNSLSLVDGMEFSVQATFGGKYLFYGIETNVFLLSEMGSDSTFVPVNFSGLLGTTFNISILRFYSEVGLGACSMQDKYANVYSSESEGGLSVSFIAGMDIFTDTTSFGVLYKLRYMNGVGLVNCVGISFGVAL